jgi:hypothetical protein
LVTKVSDKTYMSEPVYVPDDYEKALALLASECAAGASHAHTMLKEFAASPGFNDVKWESTDDYLCHLRGELEPLLNQSPTPLQWLAKRPWFSLTARAMCALNEGGFPLSTEIVWQLACNSVSSRALRPKKRSGPPWR